MNHNLDHVVGGSPLEQSEGAGAIGDEIEVTTEMVDAGILYLLHFNPKKGLSEEEAVTAIFRAMYSARPAH